MNKNFFNLQLFATKVSLTAGNDTCSNQTANKIIYALGGNDNVSNYASKVTIYGGAGKQASKELILLSRSASRKLF